MGGGILKVVCAVCGVEFRAITYTHLHKHDLTPQEYKRRFPEALIVTPEVSAALSKSAKANPKAKFQKGHTINNGDRNPMRRPEVREKQKASTPRGATHPCFGKPKSKETREKLAVAALNGFVAGTRERPIGPKNGMFGKKLSPEHKTALHSASKRRKGKTAPEKQVEKLLSWYPGWEYTGDRTFWIDFKDGSHKNPDFTNKSARMVLEVFGDYWHRNDSVDELVSKYAEVGWKCLVFWESKIMRTGIIDDFEYAAGYTDVWGGDDAYGWEEDAS